MTRGAKYSEKVPNTPKESKVVLYASDRARAPLGMVLEYFSARHDEKRNASGPRIETWIARTLARL